MKRIQTSAVAQSRAFDPKVFLSTIGAGRVMMSFRKRQTSYAQGDVADALFVIQKGEVKLSAKSPTGKEAVLDILSDGDFVGKDPSLVSLRARLLPPQ